MIHALASMPALRSAAAALLMVLAGGAGAAGLDDLFDEGAKPAPSAPAGRWSGYVQVEAARTVADPEHWSKLRTRAEVGHQDALGSGLKYKVSGRLDFDAAYSVEDDFYPRAVRRDQRRDFMWRETYLDLSAGEWDFRLGRQHIVWGEVVGLFFADVVSAKDLREFVLPEFEQLRIPQWAARAEWFRDDFHVEAVWLPLPEVDNIGRPGSDFYPFALPLPAGVSAAFEDPQRPARRLANGNFGLRLSQLIDGWDLGGFYYRSHDAQASFARRIVTTPTPTLVFTPRHARIHQGGLTLAKDLGAFVLKGEAVYTRDREFNVVRLADADGLVALDTVDWIVGADFNPGADTHINLQLFQRAFLDYDDDIVPDRHENGLTLLLNHKFGQSLEMQGLLIHSLNRSDWMLRPSVAWNFERNWRLLVGADLFHGEQLGLFGRFANRDRVYGEVRYSF